MGPASLSYTTRRVLLPCDPTPNPRCDWGGLIGGVNVRSHAPVSTRLNPSSRLRVPVQRWP
jgi:hypothetical protein